MVKTLVVGKLQTNCYLITDQKTTKTIIIDPGDDADYITSEISKDNLKPVKIIATHGHFDHILAAFELQIIFDIPLLMHKEDEFLLKRMVQSANYFTGVNVNLPPKINGYLKQKEKIKFGKMILEVIETAGHTPGSISLYSEKKKLIFVGDLLFQGGGVGRTDFSYCSHKDLTKSLKKILNLPKRTMIYSGHGTETTIKNEQRFYNL